MNIDNPGNPSRRQFATALGVAALAAAFHASAATPLDTAFSQEVLPRVLAAHGGAERLRTLRGFEFRLEGTVVIPSQSERFTPPHRATPLRVAFGFDWAGNRAFADYKMAFPGGYLLDSREISGNGQYVLWNEPRTYAKGAPFETMATAYRYHPLVTLRSLVTGKAKIGEIRQERISETDVLVLPVAGDVFPVGFEILVEPKTYLVHGYRLVRSQPHNKNTRQLVTLDGYRREYGMMLPAKYVASPIDHDGASVALSYVHQVVEPTFGVDAFDVPKGYTEVAPPLRTGPSVRYLGNENILLERLGQNEYNGFVVHFDDHVVAFEAPQNIGLTRQYIDAIKLHSNGKPLRYVVITHHHGDHAGGVRAFLEEKGVTIIAPQGAKEWLDRFAGGKIPEGRFIPIKPGTDLVLKDTGQHLKIYNLIGNPHSEQILIGYFPSRKLLFQSDLFTNHVEQADVRPANAGGIALASTIEALGLKVDVLVGGHGTIAPWLDFEHSLRKAGMPVSEK